MGRNKISSAIKEQTSLLEDLCLEQEQVLYEFSDLVVDTFNQGGRLLVVGNGALSAIASLIANLFLHRLSFDRPSLPALSLSQDVTLATALAQDGQHRLYFSRQLRAMATPNDILLILSDGRRDDALSEALTAARARGCKTAIFSQHKSDLAAAPADFKFNLNTTSIPRTVESALFFGHILCEMVEGNLFGT